MGTAKKSTSENKKVSDFFMRSHNKSDYHIFAVTLTSTNCSSTTQFKLNVQWSKKKKKMLQYNSNAYHYL